MFFLLLTVAVRSEAEAAEIQFQALDNETVFVVIEGEIEIGDSRKFDTIIQQYSKGGVLLRSPGGSLMEGMTIGETIRMKSLQTGVAPDTMCASACALAWLGGTQRFMSKDARVGFHLAYTLDEDGQARETGLGNALMGAYLTRLGLPTRAVAYIASAGPSEMNWLTAEEAKRIGIDVSLLDIEGSPARRLDTSPQIPPRTSSHYVSGLDPNGDNWLALKAGPNGKSKRLLKMGPGTRLRVLSSNGSWLQVELDDGTRGWAFSSYVACCLD